MAQAASSSSSALLNPPSPKRARHPVYYFEDGNVVFLVRTGQTAVLLTKLTITQATDTLFKVHRYFFVRDSAVFKAMFTLPPGPGKTVEGMEDENPIVLPEVPALDFERFLWVLYPPSFGEYNATVPEWCSILHLATLWDFDSIRRLAIHQLHSLSPTDMPPVERIALAHRFQLDHANWLLGPYVELAVRTTPLSLEEGRKLGVDVVVLLARAREEVKKKEAELLERQIHHDYYFGSYGGPLPPLVKRQCIWDAVAEVFGLPTVQLNPATVVHAK
ncbi:hypothetical protein FRB99_001516 [Tulasnella sp. 403]|nr:hypothetical protein FRB99_001516 [Tulasnella sp. 403]